MEFIHKNKVVLKECQDWLHQYYVQGRWFYHSSYVFFIWFVKFNQKQILVSKKKTNDLRAAGIQKF